MFHRVLFVLAGCLLLSQAVLGQLCPDGNANITYILFTNQSWTVPSVPGFFTPNDPRPRLGVPSLKRSCAPIYFVFYLRKCFVGWRWRLGRPHPRLLRPVRAFGLLRRAWWEQWLHFRPV